MATKCLSLINKFKLFLTAFLCVLGASHFANSAPGPGSFSYEGRLYDTLGNPSTQTVRVILKVYNPSGTCMLRGEQSALINLATTDGYFNVTFGQGTAIAGDPGLTLATVFANNGLITGASSCTYTPAAGEGRLLRVSIDDGGVVTTLTPDISMVSAPYAVVADSVQGKTPTDLIQVNSTSAALTQANLETIFSSTPIVTDLQTLIAGTSTKYMKSVANNGTIVPSVSTTPSSPLAGQFWYDSTTNNLKYYNGSSAITLGSSGGTVSNITAGAGLTGGSITTSGTIGLDTSGVTAGTYTKVVVDTYGRVTTGQALTSGDIPSHDASMIATGTLAGARLPANLGLWTASGSDIAYTSGNLGVGFSNPVYTLDVGGDINLTGKLHINGFPVFTAVGTPFLTNTAVGVGALNAMSSTSNNTAVGYNAGNTMTTGSSNTFIGAQSASAVTSASNNVVLGANTAGNLTSGNMNIVIGTNTASGSPVLGTGSNNILIGNNLNPSASNPTYTLNIGNLIHGNLSSGNVGIGTTTPTYNLHVVGTAGLSTGTAWTNVSDKRLKDLNGNYEYGLKEILQLQTVRYHYKKDNPLGLSSDQPMTGFVAQDVQKVIPDAVIKRQDGYLELNVDPIHWATVNAVQELHGICLQSQRHRTHLDTRIEKLEATNAALQSQNAMLEQRLQELTKNIQLIKEKLQ